MLASYADMNTERRALISQANKKRTLVGLVIVALTFSLCFHIVSARSETPRDVVGRMTSAEGITPERIARLPIARRAAWTAYLKRSMELKAADMRALKLERANILAIPSGPKHGSVRSIPLDRPREWYASREARAIADNIVSYQTPAGGWGKNQDRTASPRVPGESFVPIEDLPDFAQTDIKGDQSWRYVGTIDNGATLTELRFLAQVQAQTLGREGERYRAAFLKGVSYLLTAQFPNGGWPQVFPLQGGYHDAITFNDNAVGLTIELLSDVAARQGDFAFVPKTLAVKGKAASATALGLILKTQIVIGGKRTLWGQQHDVFTLAPAGARDFEPAALASDESASILLFLMSQKDPSPELQVAVQDGVEWLRAHSMSGYEWKRTETLGRQLVAKPGAGPLWPRFYDVVTLKPIFGDRDKNIRDNVNELSLERRNGYSWFNTAPAKAIEAFEKWSFKK